MTTVYVGGLYEEDLQTGTQRVLYHFNGQIIAQRSSDASGLIYLHADHLGSVSLATSSSGAVVSRQDFDPWGSIRSGGIPQTTLNYTGQRRDGTGLLYYHARYYDPVLARFVSADTIVPGSGALTLWPSDATAAPLFGQQNAPGPQNPQELNRYSYVNNNPMRHTDPTGHVACVDPISCGFEGAATGGVVGSAGGPVGAVAGAIVGGVAGAAVGLGIGIAAYKVLTYLADGPTPNSVSDYGELAGVVLSAEPAAAKQGKAKHKQVEQAYVDGLPADQRPHVSKDRTFVDPRTGKRFRPDIVNHETGDVIEYKPKSHQDGGRKQRKAERQVNDYADRLNDRYGDQRKLDGAPRYRGRVEYY